MKLFRAFQTLPQQRILPSIGRRLFSAPYMPRPLVGLTSFVLLNDVLLFLLRQPPEYWKNYQMVAEKTMWIYRLLEIHPLVYLGLSLCYVALVALLLDGLKYPVAMSLWAAVSFAHLWNSVGTGLVILQQQFNFTDSNWNNLWWGGPIVAFAIVGACAAAILTHVKETAPHTTPGRKSKTARLMTRGAMAIWLIFLGISQVQVIRQPVTGWQLVPTPNASPGPRVEAEIVYDTMRHKAVLFGGISVWLGPDNEVRENETWEWNGQEWEQKFPETSPPARNVFAMAYDERRGVVVLFGGQGEHAILQDTWEWDGQNWTQRYPATSLPQRANHQMLYDPQREKVVLYGGYDGERYFDDAWEWDGEQWQAIVFESTHPVASGFSMTYNPTANHILAFVDNAMWIWKDNQWGKLQVSQVPPSRTSRRIVYDSQHNHSVTYGGWDYNTNAPIGGTWIWKGLQWQLLDTTFEPPPLWGYAGFYDPVRGNVMIYGGGDGSTVYRSDLWELVLTEE